MYPQGWALLDVYNLTLKSYVYSFGVVLLEIITGRKAIGNSKFAGEQNLVAWVRHSYYFLIS